MRQNAISGICFEFLGFHPLKRLRSRCVFNLNGLPRSPFGSVCNFSRGLHMATNGIPYLRFGDQFCPSAPFGVVRDWLLELAPVSI